MPTLFISDLHLHSSRPAITSLFLDFLRFDASQAGALYILGDLFEAWVGDDDDSEVGNAVRLGLREVSANGVPVWLMRGNRDFLLGPRFAAEAGLHLLADPCVIMLHGVPTLLMHGDLLCTDDLEYLAFREQVRDPAWRERFLQQDLATRHDFVARARSASQKHQHELGGEGMLDKITDVNLGAVRAVMSQYGVNRLIHGHTHRPAIHSLRVNDCSAQRIVLGDWYHQGSVLRATSDGFELSALSTPEHDAIRF